VFFLFIFSENQLMSKSRKIFLGILSLLPLVLLAVYMATFFSFMMQLFRQGQEEIMPQVIMEHIWWIAGTAVLMGLLKLSLLIYFIIHAINNKSVAGTERIVWILVFIFAGSVGFPIYWYMRIWKDDGMVSSAVRPPEPFARV